jgi:hypothetical protein
MVAPTTRVFEGEFLELYNQVERIFGAEACRAAGNRAYDRAAFAMMEPADAWLVVFEQLWTAELRRLLAH